MHRKTASLALAGIIPAIVLLAPHAEAQAVVRGVVRDRTSLEPVTYALVTIDARGAGPVREAVTDLYGAFVVANVAAAEPTLVRVEALGYSAWEMEYGSGELPADGLRVLLVNAPIELEGIEVAGRRVGDPLSVGTGIYMMDAELVRAQPVVLETDVLRATVLSPSASASSDWVSVPFIRGGSAEGTPVRLDGVRLFNPFHVGGFVAALNAEAVKSVALVTGSSVGALSTGSLSGAIDIATRDGARDRFHTSGSLGLASARLTAEGPVGESMSFLVDGRRTYIDLLTKGLAATGLAGSRVPYSFGDVHAKLTRDFGDVRRLSLTGYWNSELLDSRPEDVPEGDDALDRATRADWGNGALAVHYRDRIGAGTLVDVNLGFSAFGGAYVVFEDRVPDSDTATVVRGKMGEYRAEVRVRHHAGSFTLDGGLQATRFEAAHSGMGSEWDGSDEEGLLLPFDISLSSHRAGAYGSLTATVGRGASATVGARVDGFVGVAATAAPFAELSHEAAGGKIWLSASRAHQALTSIRDEEPVTASFFAFDLLAPVEQGPVPRNTELSAGWEGRIRGVSLRLEGYARWLANLLLPPLGANPLGSYLLVTPDSRAPGSGTARGIEASWSWASGGSNILGSYRWSRVTRTVAGHTYVPRFHRDHEGELSASLKRGESMWSLRFSARSGQPTTPLAAFLPFTGHRFPDESSQEVTYDVLHLAGEYNSVKLPPYARIDVGWRGSWEVGWFGGGVLSPYASVANLFSLPNVVGVGPERGRTSPGAGNGVSELVYAPQIPMLPFLGVEFRF